jgi:two-component system sensor histidine kinase BaeS
MRLKLIHKLLIAMFACAALVLVLTMLIARAGIGRGFVDFLEQQENARAQALITDLSLWYTQNNGWGELPDNPRRFYSMVFAAFSQPVPEWPAPESGGTPSQPPAGAGQGRQRQGRGAPPGAGPGGAGPGAGMGFGPGGRNSLAQRLFLLDADKNPVTGMVSRQEEEHRLLPIAASGEEIGWLGIASAPAIHLPEEEEFIRRLRDNLAIGLGIGMAAAALLAWVLARHLSQPVNRVAKGIHALAAGDYGHRLEATGGDEIARLGDDLNRLAAALGEHEAARKRVMSDIAHELRTPLAIINGELEAMRDGIRPLDEEQLESVRDEVRHLSTLVDDLHSLTMTDAGTLAYKMAHVDLGELVQLAVDSFRDHAAQKEIGLGYAAPGKAVTLRGDAQLVRQLLDNLLDNAVRYTDPEGSISVALGKDRQVARLVISDTAPGASEEECGLMFERLYRLDASRNRHSGGSGLGLAICQNIVKAHGGQISASPSDEGGIAVTTLLPLQK